MTLKSYILLLKKQIEYIRLGDVECNNVLFFLLSLEEKRNELRSRSFFLRNVIR